MDFYLIDPNGGQFHFPVNPEEVTIRRDKQYETVNIIGLGEVDFAQREKVREIAFSSFFPKTYDPSYCRYPNLPDPQEAMNQLNRYLKSRTPLRLLITDTYVNVLVFVSSHNSTLKGGEPGDVYFDLTCRTWTEAKAAASPGSQAEAAPARQRPDLKTAPAVYVVKSGDSLWSIAKRELGSGDRWRQIYEANRSVIGPDPQTIRPGQRLVLA